MESRFFNDNQCILIGQAHGLFGGKRFSINEKPRAEVVTAFTGVLELSRRSKILTNQEELFGDIVISKRKRNNNL